MKIYSTGENIKKFSFTGTRKSAQKISKKKSGLAFIIKSVIVEPLVLIVINFWFTQDFIREKKIVESEDFRVHNLGITGLYTIKYNYFKGMVNVTSKLSYNIFLTF
jgi:hypothetical protein